MYMFVLDSYSVEMSVTPLNPPDDARLCYHWNYGVCPGP